MAGSADLPEGCVQRTASLRDAVRTIEVSKLTIAVVVDEANRVLGTISDGDVRRALLNGKTLDHAAIEVMNRNPRLARAGAGDLELLETLRANNLEALPIVDESGRVLRVAHIDYLIPGDATGGGEGFYAAVIMAGGEGHRLRPVTKDIPKPMVDIGGVPLIERQVTRISRAGVRRIFVAVNYLSGVIERHLGDGAQFDAQITYLREPQKLGTAGALSLMPQPLTGPLLVINGDVLTTSEFKNFLNFHEEHQAAMTVGAVWHTIQVPYGVIRSEGVIANGLEEKPSQTFLCNAGIYVVDPNVIRLVPHGRPYDMTDLLQRCMAEGRRVVVFPIHEYWSDIGTPSDLEAARAAHDGSQR